MFEVARRSCWSRWLACASLLTISPALANASPEGESCSQLLQAIYAPPEDGVTFEDGTVLSLRDPQFKGRIEIESGVLQVARKEDITRARSLVSRVNNKHLLVAWSASGRFDPSVLRKSPETIQLLSAVPTDEQSFARVYGTATPVRPQLLKGYAHRVRKLTGCGSRCSPKGAGGPSLRATDLQRVNLKDGRDLSDYVKSQVDALWADGLIILVGHVEGGAVRLPDGSGIALERLQGRGQVWVLGCNTFAQRKPGSMLIENDMLVTVGEPEVEHVLDATRKLLLSFRQGDQAETAGFPRPTFEDVLRHAQNQRFSFLIPLTGVAWLISLQGDEDEDKELR
ncbi:hypothetical protein [Nannocystis sp. SCPEA4]|uniref:hypothetical protein n=1 Tax=Nannocystis sp. SCPEA4 TaxID=2996787 RepID=UPI00226F8C21|nr:hypothetical protein [Nannocystis sp. SCPEA4]MCY1059917.1 hypothetical protein [Nannocystis sp. SCPEA4]